MNKPLISAWIGRGNFGDELLAYGLRLELYSASELHTVSYYEKGAYNIFKSSDDVQIKHAYEVGSGFLKKIYDGFVQRHMGYDALIFGGGSIFHSLNSIKWKHELLRKFRRNGLRKVNTLAGCIGVSLGPFPTLAAETAAIKYINDLDFLHCRDKASFEFACGNSSSLEVLQGRDLAFSVRAKHPQLFSSAKVRGKIGISFLMDLALSPSQQEESFNKMLALVNRIIERGFSVMLISLYCGREHRDDVVHRNIYHAAISPERISLHHYTGDVQETLQHIASCDRYISMRLHGVISAFLSNTMTLALQDNKKIIDFRSDFDKSVEFVGINDKELSIDGLLKIVDEFLMLEDRHSDYCPSRDPVYKSSSRQITQLINNMA